MVSRRAARRVDRSAELTNGPADRSLRILHLVTRSQRRGAELVALELADELTDLGHENRVVALGAADAADHEAELPPLVDSAGTGPSALIPQVRAVRRLLVDAPADVLVAHGGWAAQVAVLAASRRGPLLVWQRIGALSPAVWKPSRRWWWRAIARRFDAGVALTKELEDELRRLGFSGPIWRIPNSRKPDRFLDLDREVAAAALRVEIGLSDQSRLIAFVGHLDAKKRADRALEVQARILASGCRTHLVIVGDGPLRRELEADALRLGLGSHVTFLGLRSDVERILAGVELLLLTSDLEGIPGVAIESVMAGCPVVSVPVGGVAEVVDHGVTGVLLPGVDLDRMAAEVVTLLADRRRLAAMSVAGRGQIQRFSASGTATLFSDSLVALSARHASGSTGRTRRR